MHWAKDGWLEGHEREAERLQNLLKFDDAGYACDASGQRIEGDAIGGLPPALQLEVRARIALGEVKVVSEWPAEKRKCTHVNLEVQRRNHYELAQWQARIGATAAYTLDGTRTRVKAGETTYEYVVARSTVRHDGTMQYTLTLQHVYRTDLPYQSLIIIGIAVHTPRMHRRPLTTRSITQLAV